MATLKVTGNVPSNKCVKTSANNFNIRSITATEAAWLKMKTLFP